jgi:pyruvate/2-oxoglutarate dehydrogenase complex dihydrolipoamide dehydrogenase (E3) component
MKARQRRLGPPATRPASDFAAAKDHVHSVIDTIAPVDSQERFEGLGVHVIRELARFISETEVQAGTHIIKARRFVIATGSRPFVPPIPGLADTPHHTNETIFDLRERPDHLIIIGGGPIGMEMAQAHRRLGSKVTVLEGAKALGKDDPEAAALVLTKLRAEGVEIVEGAKVSKVSGGEGAVKIDTEDGRSFEGSHLLVAVGRQVNVDKLDLEKAGVDYDRRGDHRRQGPAVHQQAGLCRGRCRPVACNSPMSQATTPVSSSARCSSACPARRAPITSRGRPIPTPNWRRSA